MRLFQLAIIVFGFIPVSLYHDSTNENTFYHCWPDNTNSFGQIVDCEGIRLEWIIPPPNVIQMGVHFNVSYRIHAKEEFFISRQGFKNTNMSAAELKNFCMTSPCPDANASRTDFHKDCCVWHANIHTCHPGQCGKPEQSCGPWISNDNVLSTHTKAIYGRINDTFNAEVFIDALQSNYMIAHVKLGELQIAIQSEVIVHDYYCGDNICNSDETCDSCPVDCCSSFPGYATAMIVIVVVVIALVAILLPSIWYFYQRHKLFYDESWIIDYAKIQRATHGYGGMLGSMLSLHNVKFLSDNGSGGRRPSRGSNNSGMAPISDAHKKQVFTQTGIYEGRTVAIKKLFLHDIQLTHSIRKEVMQIRVLDHPNICKFIGVTACSPGNVAIISEYCPKGSLNDVLQNEDIPLNWGFRFSFVMDIARGMSYLHSKRHYHGKLFSSNCVIDDRWVVKITDFGLPSFRKKNHADPEHGIKSVTNIYMSPEVREQQYNTLNTATSDVYSYSIILLEIATRMDPYSEEFFIDSHGKPKIPDLQEEGCPCPDLYQELIQKCWDNNSSVRPSFDQIKKLIHRMNPGQESPVDMMMIMMEKYSKHLELLVAERTQELLAEQKKTSNLLYSMLPRPVADDLRQGRPANAQAFQGATIFFSDIVGFTTLASTSTPMEVVTMLNELYSTFDDILDMFDVYKVETIGDAYMVVSGVPRENQDKHAEEIAKMALKLLSASKVFEIPHCPGDKIQIRAGIHSGSVCAGVVGQKMPRYCLFGDTVNTASRMETTSEPMKIQCSDSTYQLLRKNKDFILECRGAVEVKGKGSMLTWWLVGQTAEDNEITHEKTKPMNALYHSSSIVSDKQQKSPLFQQSFNLPGSPS